MDTEALRGLQEHLLRNPKDAQALNDAGVLLHRLERYDEAAEHLRAAVDLLGDPEREQARANLVEAYIAAAGKVHAHDAPLPYRYDRLLAEADTMETDGDYAQAARLYERMRRAHSGVVLLKGMQARALYRAGGRDEQALNLCRDVNEVRPTSETLLLEGRLLRRQDRNEEAVEALNHAREMLDSASDDAARRRLSDVLEELGDCHAALGEYDKARDCYLAASETAPTRTRPYVGLGLLGVQAGRLTDARCAFETAAHMDNACADAFGGLAMVYQQSRSYEAAFDMYLKCLELDTDNLAALLGLFQTSCQMGTFAKVIQFLEVYLNRHPGDTSVLFCLATLYARDGRLADAENALLDVLALDPDKREAAELLAGVRAELEDRSGGAQGVSQAIGGT